MSTLLLLTVGTGTAGKTSSLADGLRKTIALLAPRRFWLAPSASPDSTAMADLVREGNDAFAPASATDSYFTLPQPDDLDGCRRILRAAIAAIRDGLLPGERLILNPTSGTKQMTAAAVLAALDEGVGDIVFTTGDRADGVVVTGTERLTFFDPSGYFRERDLATARDLFDAGAFCAAARVLRPHAASLPKAPSLCQVMHHWQRFAYADAVTAASGHWEYLRALLAQRAQHVVTGAASLPVLADVLAWADHGLRLGESADCLTLAYKALELAARFALAQDLGLAPSRRSGRFDVAAVRALARCRETDARLEKLARDGEVALGLSVAMQLLAENAHPLGCAFAEDNQLVRLTFVRNESVHDIRPPDMAEAQAFLDRVRNLLAASLPRLPSVVLPREMPDA